MKSTLQNSVLHCNLVHEFIPVPQAMKIPDAKAAVDKEWKKLETIPAWDVRKIKSKKEVIKEAQKNNNKIHFASLMDLYHLKNSELEPQFQKYKRKGCASRRHWERRLWSPCSVYWTGLIGIANVGRKSNGCYCSSTRLWRTSSWRNFGVHPGKNGGWSKASLNNRIRMSRCMDTSSKT